MKCWMLAIVLFSLLGRDGITLGCKLSAHPRCSECGKFFTDGEIIKTHDAGEEESCFKVKCQNGKVKKLPCPFQVDNCHGSEIPNL